MRKVRVHGYQNDGHDSMKKDYRIVVRLFHKKISRWKHLDEECEYIIGTFDDAVVAARARVARLQYSAVVDTVWVVTTVEAR